MSTVSSLVAGHFEGGKNIDGSSGDQEAKLYAFIRKLISNANEARDIINDLRADSGVLTALDSARNLASIAGGAAHAAWTVAVTGAALGDRVEVSCSIDSLGLIFSGWVSAVDVVSLIAFNPTAAPIDLGAANFRVYVAPAAKSATSDVPETDLEVLS